MKNKLFLCLVGIPLLLSIVYLFGIADNQYISRATAIIKRENNKADLGSFSLIPDRAGTSYKDALIFREYAYSKSMLAFLESKYHLRKHYKQNPIDILSYLPANASEDEFQKFYARRLNIMIDEESSLIKLNFRDESPQYAQAILSDILEQGALYLNTISQKVAEKQLDQAMIELTYLKEQMQISKSELAQFQANNQILSPEMQASSLSAVLATLEAKLTEKEIELENTQNYLSDNAYQIIGLKKNIQELKNKIQEKRQSLANPHSQNNALNNITLGYEGYKQQYELLQEMYRSLLISLQDIRNKTTEEFSYLVPVDTPSQATKSEYPQRIYALIVILIIYILLYAIIRLILATVSEYRT